MESILWTAWKTDLSSLKAIIKYANFVFIQADYLPSNYVIIGIRWKVRVCIQTACISLKQKVPDSCWDGAGKTQHCQQQFLFIF